MVAPVVVPSVPLKGTVIRVTREDVCGVPLCGLTGAFVTNGWIELNLSAEIDAGTDFTQKLADGDYCVRDKDDDTVKWFNAEIKMCGVNPALLEIMGKTPVLGYDGKLIGFKEEGVSTARFGLELWNVLGNADCSSTGDAEYWYSVIPGLKSMLITDIQHGNKLLDVTAKGLTFLNPNWGKGPYNVVPSAALGNPAGPLLTCMGDSEFYRSFQTPTAPPTASDQYVAVTCLEGGADGDPAVVVPCV